MIFFRSFHNDFEVRLKWPNDIYYKNQVRKNKKLWSMSFNLGKKAF